MGGEEAAVDVVIICPSPILHYYKDIIYIYIYNFVVFMGDLISHQHSRQLIIE